MSGHHEIKFNRLIDRLLDELRHGFEENAPPPLAAGITQLEKIEILKPPKRLSSSDTKNWIQEALLIRIRQNRYSAIAIIEEIAHETKESLVIHVESTQRQAVNFIIPYKRKRVGVITFGQETSRKSTRRFFRED